MNILFIHGNYPAQFRHLASGLGKQNIHDVRFLTAREDCDKYPLEGVKIENYTDSKKEVTGLDRIGYTTLECIQRGLTIQKSISKLIEAGFTPRLIIFHAGNGIGMFIRTILPDAKLIGYFEWYFSSLSAELILGKNDINSYNAVSARNIAIQHELLQSDNCIVPTKWQAKQFPEELQKKLTIIFDGIDRNFFAPLDDITSFRSEPLTITGESNSIQVSPDEFLISYATRGMEPLRGFPEFMRILPQLLNAIPNLKVLIGGRDRSAYSPAAPNKDGSWKTLLLEELGDFPGKDRIIFTGLMNYGEYRKLLHRTNLHFYFTRPYVTSWSLFEAAACGTPIFTNRCEATTGTIAIDKEYTIENINDLSNEKTLNTIIKLIQRQPLYARESHLSSDYYLDVCLDKWGKFINNTLNTG